MIVVCGELIGSGATATMPAATATHAAALAPDPGVIQAVGIIPDGPEGEASLQRLVASGVGHVAVLRTARRPLEAADIDLAIRYLPDVRVVVAIDLPTDALRAALDAATYAEATPIVVLAARDASREAGRDAGPDGLGVAESGLSPSAIVLGAPASDPDGTFAGFLAAFAVRIDGGAVPADAWAGTVRALAVDEVRATGA